MIERAKLERQASQNAPMPKGLSGAEQMLYQGLCYLYARHRAGDINPETGKAEKAELMERYEEGRRQEEIWERQQRRWADLAGPAAEFRKTKSTEAAQRMHDILYGL